jgi:hypothetical protein
MPAMLSTVITCPPPTKGAATKGTAAMMKALAASIEDRLDRVTDWATHTLGFRPLSGAAKGTIASAEPNARLRTEDGESGSITGVQKKLA